VLKVCLEWFGIGLRVGGGEKILDLGIEDGQWRDDKDGKKWKNEPTISRDLLGTRTLGAGVLLVRPAQQAQ
jgi:hypothetical protein